MKTSETVFFCRRKKFFVSQGMMRISPWAVSAAVEEEYANMDRNDKHLSRLMVIGVAKETFDVQREIQTLKSFQASITVRRRLLRNERNVFEYLHAFWH